MKIMEMFGNTEEAKRMGERSEENTMNYRSQIDNLLIEHRIASDAVESEEEALSEVEDLIVHAEEAQSILQHVSQVIQQAAHSKISDVVSRCLESIFDEPYKFKIKFERKRGRTEAKLLFERNGLEVDPLTASGGGVIDIASFALRLACLVLTRPPLRRLLVLDEHFKHISVEYRPKIKKLLEVLSKEMKIQIIMVTHQNELATGNVIRL